MLGYELLTETEREADLQAVKARLENKNYHQEIQDSHAKFTIPLSSEVNRLAREEILEDRYKYTILTDLQTTAALRSGQTVCADRCPICIDNYPSVIEPAYELEGITRYNQNDGTLCKECWGTLWIDSDRLKLVNGRLELKE